MEVCELVRQWEKMRYGTDASELLKWCEKAYSVLKSLCEFDTPIADAIRYPEEWDTAAYPTLASALWERLKGENIMALGLRR